MGVLSKFATKILVRQTNAPQIVHNTSKKKKNTKYACIQSKHTKFNHLARFFRLFIN